MKSSLRLLIGLLFVSTLAFGQSEKRITKEYDNSIFKSMQINNSFGNIEITPYSGSKIEVLIILSAKNLSGAKATEFFEKVKFDIAEIGSVLNISTQRPENVKIRNEISNFRIDFKVQIPENLNVDLTNSFGDLRINGISGKLKVKLRHGDCYIAYANGQNNVIDVKFGDVRIESLGKSKVDMQHGDLHVDTAHELTLNSQFGDIHIGKLGGKSIFNIEHGDMDIDNLSSKFNGADIRVQFGDVDISGLTQFDLDLDLSGNFSDFSYDKSWNVKSKSKGITNSSYHIQSLKGATSVKNIKIVASYSDVDLE